LLNPSTRRGPILIEPASDGIFNGTGTLLVVTDGCGSGMLIFFPFVQAEIICTIGHEKGNKHHYC